jgi:hypothetical protein
MKGRPISYYTKLIRIIILGFPRSLKPLAKSRTILSIIYLVIISKLSKINRPFTKC